MTALFAGYSLSVADSRAKLAEDRAYRPKIKLPLVPPLFRRPERRYVVEVGCPGLDTCEANCASCPQEPTRPWVVVGRLVALNPDRADNPGLRVRA